jgi:uncharacterized protein (UPF0248 family)
LWRREDNIRSIETPINQTRRRRTNKGLVLENLVTDTADEKSVVHPLKNVLNRLRWDSNEDPEDYVITYRHRGAPDDVKIVRASTIKNLGKSYFTIQEVDGPDESVIPFHRILEIRNTIDDSLVWISRKSNPGNNYRKER